jgi:peptidylprolyl isomerase/FKBP-type peptidyl-prolyl cis-trans isomerase SlpA
MAEAKQGDKVRVHYTGKLEDGTVFDSSKQRDPLELTLGSGQVIPGFEQALYGMQKGDSKEVQIAPAEGYGDRREEMVIQFERQSIPQGVDPQVGQQLQLQTQDGQAVPAVVVGTDDNHITVDANHPLAGKELHFELELVEIV